jgi:CubicO group peptidase (beta-lactamase class C family)
MTGLRSMSLGLAALLMAGTSAQAEVPDGPAIDAAVARLMRDTGSRGLAVAVVDDGRVAYVQAYGARNAAGAPSRPTPSCTAPP